MDFEMRAAHLPKESQGQAHVTEIGSGHRGRDRDAAMLAVMGKKQVLKRNFGFLSMLSFSCTILGTWEGVLIIFASGFLK
ncbi:uncharacterized protein UV8b_05994 [Ustilaginoidea virens]|uniref:Uncharacterized protein n=1 Tax=Ustilaginoidea virens TaxID=1159556 RepID=A0A8E5MJ78_USTVR|nr:uncharacterized protein UV8b_05994 [Ustilaginoidea virens]QUC21751.1 hypothetical protein UV8b_05994 [Ustilaginoidea virens]